MDFYRKNFVVGLSSWVPESLEKRALAKENASVVRDAISDSMQGNRPFMINFVTADNVCVAQMTASGCSLCAAKLVEVDNWITFGYIPPGQPIMYFGPYSGKLDCVNRAGNDEIGITLQDTHANYHMHTQNCSKVELIGIPRNKEDLPIIGECLTKKLLTQIGIETKVAPLPRLTAP